MAANDKKESTVTITTRPRKSSESSIAPSLKTPRTARFAEATAVHSPIEPSERSRNPFSDPPTYTTHIKPQPQPSDVGFGYMDKHASHQEVEIEETDRRYLAPQTPASPLKSPLKSAMKSPGAAPRDFGNIMSPTFREEQILEKHEEDTEKEQAKDLKVKFRVRMAKIVLRFVNFSCSLIVLSMLAATFTIFNATKQLPQRSGLPAWANQQSTWPQILMLVIACVSLAMAVIILWTYWRSGHHRAEKVAVYYTVFAVAFFIFSIVMWAIGAAVLNTSKQNGNGQDMWGWSCKDNKRKTLFQEDVDYALVCRLQNWSLVCAIIEIVIELITIAIYGIVFYRFWSKRKLRKSMAIRDRARSDMYLAQLRSQSAPNTPGFGPLSPRDGGWRPPPGHPQADPVSAAEMGEAGAAITGEGVQYPRGFAAPKPFQLQPPPIKVQSATPRTNQGEFSPVPQSASPPPQFENVQDHVPAAPGEQEYAPVAIPGAYASPAIQSPTQTGFNFGTHQR